MREEKFRELQAVRKVVEKLDRDLDSIIVEGESDSRVMKDLGFTGKVFLSAEKDIEDLVENVSRGGGRTAILTDFDAHGKKQSGKIRQALEPEADYLSLSSRREFGRQLTSEDRYAVEDLRPLLDDRDERFKQAALSRLYTFD